ncbi:hypothetical protein D9Q98_005688 [Chlorella vulgaris]|uniref:Uncharacterized protein n=1 Tax=Chlorella vulgaris TaxID=3077 RepID=A0A9D4TMQ1_CHLVU|nr:hypothetical protein D9Q98_005688 [Chlorella vulgaris]
MHGSPITRAMAMSAGTQQPLAANSGPSEEAAAPQSPPFELADDFAGLVCGGGLMTIAGFGSLLSETSARSTFPELQNFRQGRLKGWRRVFTHQCNIFFARGIARPETREVSSLSVEEHEGAEIVVSLFEVAASPAAIAAFIEREHEFRFMAVEPLHLDGSSAGRRAVVCARWNDGEYKRRRCPPAEWQRRYGEYGVDTIWTDNVLPCRVYLRHCVLAAQRLGSEAHASFLDGSVLSDRTTTVRQHLAAEPGIMDELPPPSLIGRDALLNLLVGLQHHPRPSPSPLALHTARIMLLSARPSFDSCDRSGDCSVFVVSQVVNASGGRTGCFLYRGSLITPQPRSHTPDCSPRVRFQQPQQSLDLLLPGSPCAADEEEAANLNLSAYEGQELTLYMSYEEASPKIKQRLSRCGSAAPSAPWRAILRDSADDMLYCLRGLPIQIQLDSRLHLATWGASVAIAFATAADAQTFVAGVARVQPVECCLADTPQGILLARHTAELALRQPSPTTPAPRAKPGDEARPAGTCPSSPARYADAGASGGGKRKAASMPFLNTPAARPRLMAAPSTACCVDPGSIEGRPILPGHCHSV